jgi:soluble lytic murein transglycosylase
MLPESFRTMRLSPLVVFLLTLAAPAGASAADADGLAEQRAVFVEAWRRAGRGDTDALKQAVARIPDYVLTPYLRFELKRQTLDRVSGPEMERFLARYRNWSFAAGLEQQWLDRLAERGEREMLLRYGDNARSAEARCQLERARLERGRIDGLAERVRALWLHPASQPRACDPLFAWWMRQGNPDLDTAWERFGLAVDAGELRLARYLRRYLAPADRLLADGWMRIASRPARGLAAAEQWPDRERARRLLAWGLYRLAGSDWQQARTLLQRLEARFSFEPDEIGAARRRIALFQAVDLDPDAVAAIDALDAGLIDQQMLEWRLRAALAHGEWAEALASIERMSAEQQLRERWRYWRARALAELGRPEAGLVYATLASESDYYGFLAALRSGQPLTLCSRDIAADGEIQRRLLRDAEFERAMELFRAGLPWHARWTFQRVAERLSGRELRQAALLAAGAGWHDRAITALARSGAMDAYPWRFPLVERERVVRAARDESIEPALVMGLMRAESAMQPDARSPAGARGLLQLMDGTARAVARRHGIGYSGPSDLYSPARNIALGTAHLGELYERFDGDWTLVAAAYNAGLRNAERWQRERPDLARDVWIETLPFYETRDYIPRVLAFATIYEWKLGADPRVLAANVLGSAGKAPAFGCPAT